MTTPPLSLPSEGGARGGCSLWQGAQGQGCAEGHHAGTPCRDSLPVRIAAESYSSCYTVPTSGKLIALSVAWSRFVNGSFGGSNRLVLCSAVVFLAAAGVIGEALQSFSIVGLYITFVLAVGRFIRAQSSDLRLRIPFENLPNCERYAGDWASSVLVTSAAHYTDNFFCAYSVPL